MKLSDKQYQEAVQAYTKAIELDPENAIYYSNRYVSKEHCQCVTIVTFFSPGLQHTVFLAITKLLSWTVNRLCFAIRPLLKPILDWGNVALFTSSLPLSLPHNLNFVSVFLENIYAIQHLTHAYSFFFFTQNGIL